MCGIVGFVGQQEAAPILLDGLRRLEYRGYDSAGIAVCGAGGIAVAKSRGRLQVLSDATHAGADLPGVIGIGHTRWATHGEPNDINAHPHLGRSGRIAVVHNGIIENYMELKLQLLEKGYTFRSETDTEVVAQLLDYYYEGCGDFFEALNCTLNAVDGAYALAIICADYPDRIYATRKDAPLLLGYGE
ncbi:MAG: glutamine--fructose-6-phosphate aminotransferase, partial [Oscillospiraceae bacterium]|nr:glutamine--fructose-6-phosphate aminotransferase [Oscillospiraceae bacterium]